MKPSRKHAGQLELSKTYMIENEIEWNQNLNLVCLAFYTAVHESAGLTSFDMAFGGKANIPSGLSTTSFLTYQKILEIWMKRYEDYFKKGGAALRKKQEHLK